MELQVRDKDFTILTVFIVFTVNFNGLSFVFTPQQQT